METSDAEIHHPALPTAELDTAKLLSEFARIMNRSGPDSPEAAAFLELHQSRTEFLDLARLSATLKRALTARRVPVGQDAPDLV